MTSLRMYRTAFAVAVTLASLGAAAAPAVDRAAVAAAKQRYAQELAICNSGRSNQSRAVCLQEAHAAHAQAMRGELDHGVEPYAANARARCAAHRGDDYTACLARMRGQGTVSGSVAGGGLTRELVTVVPAPAASAASAAR